MSKIKELLFVTNEDIAKARKCYNKSEQDMKRDVNILKEWLRQQPHLPDNEDEIRLENMLLSNKCRIEQTKLKLDNYYAFKCLFPDVMAYYDMDSELFENAFKNFYIVPSRKMTDKMERIIYVKVKNSNLFTPQCYYVVLLLLELIRTYDYSTNVIYFVDWAGMTFDNVKMLDFAMIQKLVHISYNSLSGRFTSIIYLNAPAYADIILKLLKLVLKPKLFDKIQSHSSIESVYDTVPKDLLPIDYGGKEKSLDELHDEWFKEFKCQKEFFNTVSKKRSNEKLRTGSMQGNELFGTEGTFKKLNLD